MIETTDRLTEGWDTQRKLVDALGHLSRVRDADVQIGTTPKDEVLQIDKTMLYRYRPMVEKPAPVPILLSYALVGRYTMMDLQEDRSLVRNLLRAGLDVYVVDWGHPSRADRFAGLDDYVNDYLAACVDEICRRHGVDGHQPARRLPGRRAQPVLHGAPSDPHPQPDHAPSPRSTSTPTRPRTGSTAAS